MGIIMRRKVLMPILFLCLTSMILAAVLMPATPAEAAYDSVYKKDSWGNKVTITTRINKYSNCEVEVKAYAKSWGASFMSWGIAFPMFFGAYLDIDVYGYVYAGGGRWNKVYSSGYTTSRGWMSTKTIRWTRLPKNLGKIVVYTRCKFSSIPFGNAYINKNMYAYA